MSGHTVKLTARLHDAAQADHEVTLESGMAMPSSKQMLWIDVSRNAADLELIDQVLGLDGMVSRLIEPATRPQVLTSKDSVRLRVIGMTGGDSPGPVSVDIVATHNAVVSIHDTELEELTLPVDMTPDETNLGAMDEAAFVAVLLDGVLSGYFRAVDDVEERIDEYDQRALRARRDDMLVAELVALRGKVAVIRRALNPQREVFYALERPGLVLGNADPAALALVADRFRQAVEAVENARELLVGCFDILISRSGERTNDVMRTLTVISSILLPAVVIAGIMGMNFKVPIFDDPTNFYLVLTATAAVAVVILVLAKWRHWI